MKQFAQRHRTIYRRLSVDDDAVKQILSFQDLENGWHFGSGEPPSIKEISSAILFVSLLRAAGAEVVETFPDPEGGILVAGYLRNENSIEIFCRGDSTFESWICSDDGEDVSHLDLSIDEAIQTIEEYSWRPQLSFGYCTQSISAPTNLDITVLRLKTHQREGYPLLTRTALQRQAGPSVDISANSILWASQENRQYFGESL